MSIPKILPLRTLAIPALLLLASAVLVAFQTKGKSEARSEGVSATADEFLVAQGEPKSTGNKKQNAKPETKSADIPAEEKPFWDSAKAFVDAYADRDAKAIGELFTEDAEFFDEFGEATIGREAIIAMFQAVFDGGKGSSIDEIIIESVRPITDNVVLEAGEVVSTASIGGPVFHNRYVALHVKGKDGKWRINTLKDHPREPGARHEQLLQLEWLIGEWVNEDDKAVVHTDCVWSEDSNYLLRTFSVHTYDGRTIEGVQRVGWDAHEKKLRSWTFDSEGGFLTGEWSRDENTWVLTQRGVNAEGETISGTAVYTVIDAEMVTWQLQNVVVGDNVTAAGPVVTMVRRPPTPKAATNP